MTKLLNRKTIQYIKQGQVLYGYNGLDIKNFEERYSDESYIRKRFDELYKTNVPIEVRNLKFKLFLDSNFIKLGKEYYRKDSDIAKDILFKNRLIQDKKYKEYYRDPLTGKLYKKELKISYSTISPYDNRPISVAENYTLVDKNVIDDNGTVLLKARENGNFGKYHTDLDVAYGNWQGKKVAVRYNKDNKTWTFNPVDDGINKWMNADPNLSKYLNSLYSNSKNFTTTAAPATTSTTSGNTEGNTEGNTSTGDNTSTSGSQTSSGTATEGPAASNFEALNVTDRRDIVPSVVSQPQVSQTSPSTRLLPKVKPVARPKDMPLMNRSDVRYTISDVTGSSPYFSSDVELVNSLAGTSNDNMFKQALMNRLGMDKWDNTTALNRLNFLGIKGHIGGSDRKRLRNLINKGTTIEGTIRKKQGGKLKLIKRYG